MPKRPFNDSATSDNNGQAAGANFSREKSEEPASRSDDMTTSTVVTSTEHPQDNVGDPEPSWSAEQLGEFACLEHKHVVKAEHDHALHAWLLGAALMFAKAKVPHGGWMAYCERYGLDKNQVSRSMRLFKKYPNKNDVKGKSVAELLRNVKAKATPRKKKVAAASPSKEQPNAAKVAVVRGPIALGNMLAANGTFRPGQFSVPTVSLSVDDDATACLTTIEEKLRDLLRILAADRTQRTKCRAEWLGRISELVDDAIELDADLP